MENLYHAIRFTPVTKFLDELPTGDKAKIVAGVSKLEQGDFKSSYVKTLRGQIRELIVKQYRVIFFIHEHSIFLVCAFRKESKKTPRGEIEYAERVYTMFIRNQQNI